MSDNFIFLTRVTFIQVYERLSYNCIVHYKRVMSSSYTYAVDEYNGTFL